jgi:hypothetical protein
VVFLDGRLCPSQGRRRHATQFGFDPMRGNPRRPIGAAIARAVTTESSSAMSAAPP